MKIRDEPVNNPEPKPRIDKKGRITRSFQKRIFFGETLECSSDGGSRGDDASSSFPTLAHGDNRIVRQKAEFRMHMVIPYVRDGYGAKRAEPDMERHPRNRDAFRPYRPQKRLGKMETRRWRRAGTCFSGEDGLIGLFRRRRIGDVGRQRNIADRIKKLQNIDFFREANDTDAFIQLIEHGKSGSIAKDHPHPGMKSLGGTHERLPLPKRCSLRSKQKNFDSRRAWILASIEAGRQNASIVQNEKILRSQQIGQIPETTMFEAFDVPSKNEQSR